jgi:hypothetical protein
MIDSEEDSVNMCAENDDSAIFDGATGTRNDLKIDDIDFLLALRQTFKIVIMEPIDRRILTRAAAFGNL